MRLPAPAIAQGLARFAGIKGRLQKKAGLNGATLIDDTYNANPESVRAAVAVLAQAPGRRLLVLGDMGELGAGAAQMHAEIGNFARESGVERLLTLGEHAAHAPGRPDDRLVDERRGPEASDDDVADLGSGDEQQQQRGSAEDHRHAEVVAVFAAVLLRERITIVAGVVGELAREPFELAGEGLLLVRAVGVAASPNPDAARAFVEFLATGDGNAAFRACGRDPER